MAARLQATCPHAFQCALLPLHRIYFSTDNEGGATMPSQVRRRCPPRIRRGRTLDVPQLRISPLPLPPSPCQSASSAGLSSRVSILPADSFILRAASLGGRARVKPDPLPEVRRDSALAGGLSHRLPHQTSPSLRRLWRIATSGEGRKEGGGVWFGCGEETSARPRTLRPPLPNPRMHGLQALVGPNPRLFDLRQLHLLPLMNRMYNIVDGAVKRKKG